MESRRQFLAAAAGCSVAALCAPRVTVAERESQWDRVEASIAAGSNFLVGKQAAEGAWKSDVYGPLKDGPSLTALIAATMSERPNANSQVARDRATEYLASLVRSDGSVGSVSPDITYPIYAAAGAIQALMSRRYATTRDAWIRYLRQYQLAPHLGWQPGDLAYGGWSYAASPPRPVNGKPPSPLAVPNLSATVFALEALRSAGVPASDPAILAAKSFVERCQNFTDDEAGWDARFDDGGFFFLIEDPFRNKAGEAGTVAQGRVRYRSYGSTTADGLRALLLCGVPNDHPRVDQAVAWLGKHFSAHEHPGEYAAERAHVRQAIYYYYAAAVADALARATEAGYCSVALPSRWAETLAAELVNRQRRDGSWANPIVDTREDDPLVATPLAMRALTICQRRLAASG